MWAAMASDDPLFGKVTTASFDAWRAVGAPAELSSRSWLGPIFKLLITHLQLLGLLRTIKMDWPAGVDKLMRSMDQTQARAHARTRGGVAPGRREGSGVWRDRVRVR